VLIGLFLGVFKSEENVDRAKLGAFETLLSYECPPVRGWKRLFDGDILEQLGITSS
jgi:hypothetical protein